MQLSVSKLKDKYHLHQANISKAAQPTPKDGLKSATGQRINIK